MLLLAIRTRYHPFCQFPIGTHEDNFLKKHVVINLRNLVTERVQDYGISYTKL